MDLRPGLSRRRRFLQRSLSNTLPLGASPKYRRLHLDQVLLSVKSSSSYKDTHTDTYTRTHHGTKPIRFETSNRSLAHELGSE